MSCCKERGGCGLIKQVKPYKGMAMEGAIARWYDRTRGAAPEQALMVQNIEKLLPNGGRILEVAPGPGYLAIELAKLGIYEVVGVDISKTFIEIAKENAKKVGAEVTFCLGNASALPFESDSFDFIICVAAFKNFSQPLEAITEMHRVLKRGGRALISDLRHDASLEEIDHHINNEMKLQGFNAFMTRWTFRSFLLKNAYTKSKIEELVAGTPFIECSVREEGISLDIELRKD